LLGQDKTTVSSITFAFALDVRL